MRTSWTKEELQQILADAGNYGWDPSDEERGNVYNAPSPLLAEYLDWSGIPENSPLVVNAIQSQIKYGGKAGTADPATGQIILAPEFGNFTGAGWQDLEGNYQFRESPGRSFFQQMGGWDTVKGLGLVGTVAGGGYLLAPEVAAGGAAAEASTAGTLLDPILAGGAGGVTLPAAAAPSVAGGATAAAGGYTLGATTEEIAAAGGDKIGGSLLTKMAADTGTNYLIPAIVGSQVAGSLIGADAAKKQANIGADAAQNAINAQLKMYFQSREDLAPWREAGTKAVGQLSDIIAKGPGEFVPAEQPGYEFGYKEFVEKPLLRNASATGKLRSGETLKALSDRAQNYASMSYDNWLNRWLTKMQPMQSLAGLGLTGANTTAQVNTQTGQNIGNNILAGGVMQGQGAINQANALTGGIKGVGGTLLDALVLNKITGGNMFGNAAAP